ncbi:MULTISPECIES: SDR family NAD(P)-dependent oxidoreductase [unclassified Exiguobacterium]|uniref:SDR family NAD(P)-dependent oxidoreductase n=1 Tax=unclassified Exiguobacterium TaxID=2644629 RepID=UPI001BEB5B75|nr:MULTISPECIES: SDR family NAD(P)-dependent oxidoreductase [unclassified Exiguobacterium]
MNLKDKVAIVTGAGSGIGRATALRLAAEGVNVIVNYSQSEEGALEVVKKIMNDGDVAIPYRADVSLEHEVQDMVTHTLMVFGKIDFLVNNASITSQIPMNELDEVTGEVWDSLFAVNVKGMFHCVKAVVPHMKRQSTGVIVNLGSVAGVNGIGSSIPYAATKSAIHTMTRSLAISLAPDIRVNCISPGAVATRWWAGNEERMHGLAGQLPLKRISTLEDITDTFLFQLIQSFITEKVFVMDNDQTL